MQLGWSPVNFHPFLSPSQCLPRFCAGCQCSSERGRAGVGSAAHAVSLETAVWVCCFSPERLNSRIQTLNHRWGLNVGSESRGHLTVIKGIFLLRAVFACRAEPPGLPQPARGVPAALRRGSSRGRLSWTEPESEFSGGSKQMLEPCCEKTRIKASTMKLALLFWSTKKNIL